MSGYELSKYWYEFCGDNSEKVNTNHHALFFWIVEKANRLQWTNVFGLPSDEAMHYLGINTYKTYIKTFRELVDFGFIEIVSESKNQYTSNKICFGNFYQSIDQSKVESNDQSKAKALTKAEPTQSEYNKTLKTKELLNIEPLNNSNVEISKIEIIDHTQTGIISSPILNEPIKTDSEKEKEKSSAKKEKDWVDGQGDGELHELLKQYYLNPISPKYEADMYKKFKAYWTAIVRLGTGKGKELWRTEKTFNISLRLSTWKNNELRTANNWGKGAKPIPLAPTGTEPINGRAFGKL